MPALTHGRVKNGFNGGRRLKQARNSCPGSGIPTCGSQDASRRNAKPTYTNLFLFVKGRAKTRCKSQGQGSSTVDEHP